MKILYKVNPKLSFELDAAGQKEVFKSLSSLQEIFGEESCGMCNKTDIRFSVRNVDDNDYYELRCTSCNAALPFGQHKKGDTLFPKRKDENNNWLPNRGWFKWQKENNTKSQKS